MCIPVTIMFLLTDSVLTLLVPLVSYDTKIHYLVDCTDFDPSFCIKDCNTGFYNDEGGAGEAGTDAKTNAGYAARQPAATHTKKAT